MCQSAGKTFELAWLTCAIESEGSVQLAWGARKDGYIQLVPRVNIGNKDAEYIAQAVKFAEAIGVYGSYSGYKDKRTGMMSVVWYGCKRVRRLLEIIHPYLCTRKRTIALTIIEFIDYRFSVDPHVRYGEKEMGLFFKVRELNGKGIISNQMLRDRFNARMPQKTRACASCGKIFPYVRSDNLYCSRKCVDAAYFSKESSETIRHAQLELVKI
jgi:hypothetical protein